jgi:hypothetical protein
MIIRRRMAPLLKHIFKISCCCCFWGGKRTRNRARRNILIIKSGRYCFIQMKEGSLFKTDEIKKYATVRASTKL